MIVGTLVRIGFIIFLHEVGCISLNNGPILKIQDLAYSGEGARSGQNKKTVALDARDDVTCACVTIIIDAIMATITISLTAWWILLGKLIWPRRLYIPKIVTVAPILREQDSFY